MQLHEHHGVEGDDVLDEFRLFRSLGAEATQVAEEAVELHRRRGQVLFRQGAPARSFYAVRSGRLKLTRVMADGQLVLLRLAGPGEAIGGVAALGERRYPVSAEVIADCRVLAWSGNAMDRLLRAHPQLAINLIDLLAERLHELQARYQELATEQVEQRLARLLLRLVRQVGRRTDDGVLIDVRLSRQELAGMSGTCLFTVSRLLSRWQQAGVIRTQRQRVLIRHPHGLVSIAEGLDASAGRAEY